MSGPSAGVFRGDNLIINKGWYPDPARKNRRRYWDGSRWVGGSRLTVSSLIRRTAAITGGVIGGLFLLLIVLALVLPSTSEPGPLAAAPATTPGRQTPSTAAETSGRPSASPSPTPTLKPTPKPTPTPRKSPSTASAAPSKSPVAGTALAAVAALSVKGRAPRTGYARSLFGSAWSDVDHNGCRQRDDVLNRDLTEKTFDGCKVLTGELTDPYTKETILFRRGQATSAEVQIDHVVALSDSWQKGAQQWPPDKRRQFANDTMNLIAVGRSVNASKGDGDTATWLPPNKAFRCSYVARQVTVKKTYGLWVTAAERDAMVRVLSTCPTHKLPRREPIPAHPAPRAEHSAHHSPKQRPTHSSPAVAPRQPSDEGGSCAPGYSPCIPPYPPDLNCSDLDGPVRVTGDDPHGLDRDGDGVGCETS